MSLNSCVHIIVLVTGWAYRGTAATQDSASVTVIHSRDTTTLPDPLKPEYSCDKRCAARTNRHAVCLHARGEHTSNGLMFSPPSCEFKSGLTLHAAPVDQPTFQWTPQR